MIDRLKYKLIDNDNLSELTLTHSPSGWKDSNIIWQRSDAYHGLFRSLTMPMRFLKEGASFLRNAFYQGGAFCNVDCIITSLDGLTLAYSGLYYGKVNFSQCKDSNYYFEANIIEGGLSADFSNNNDKEYEIYFNEVTAGHQLFAINDMESMDYEALTAYGLFYQLMDKITGGKISDETYGIKSDFLTDLNWDLCIVNGRLLRGVLAPIKTTLSDFFASIDAIYCIGIGVEIIDGKETIVLEERGYFYDNTLTTASLSTAELTVSIEKEKLVNEVVCGYDVDQVDDVSNSYYEPNTYLKFAAPGQQKKSYDIQSKYRADWAGIQEILGTSVVYTESLSNDYVNWLLHIKYTPNDTYCIGTGFVENEISGIAWKNILLSPRRCLNNHAKYLRSVFYPSGFLGGGFLTFTAGGINEVNNLTSLDGIIVVDEAANYDASGSDRMFKNFVIECDVVTTTNIAKQLQLNGKGRIQITYRSNTYYGFVLSAETPPTDKAVVKLKLLCSPDTDLSNLIR